ncbi:MAG: chorismate synthase [Bacteroidales bacterium]|jgi:chorismate synthase|nr:chorismate synthase [Bacteroidales bacterium]
MNNFGKIFNISIFGSSHSTILGVIINGIPPGILLKESDFFEDLEKREPKFIGTTDRKEIDFPRIKSGIYQNYTDGSPLCIVFENGNVNSEDYNFNGFFRPGHADFVANKKYQGFNNPNGGGIFSGRMTVLLVAVGVVAKKIISEVIFNTKILSVGGSKNIEEKIEKTIRNKDSVGGIIECEIKNVPIGFGEPFFDGIESVLSHAVFSIPGIKAIEFGDGIKAASMFGSEYNDLYINKKGKTSTNNSGGINGGISNGNNLVFRVFVRPPSSIQKNQQTLNFKTNKIENFQISGRHDVCFATRIPIIVEAVAAIVLADFHLLNH